MSSLGVGGVVYPSLEQGRLDALPVHEAPGRGVRGRRAAPQGEVVMVVAVAVVTQR